HQRGGGNQAYEGPNRPPEPPGNPAPEQRRPHRPGLPPRRRSREALSRKENPPDPCCVTCHDAHSFLFLRISRGSLERNARGNVSRPPTRIIPGPGAPSLPLP